MSVNTYVVTYLPKEPETAKQTFTDLESAEAFVTALTKERSKTWPPEMLEWTHILKIHIHKGLDKDKL